MRMYPKRDKKDDEDSSGTGSAFIKVVKTSALQEAKNFNETPVNARKCALILTKILYLFNQGEVFSTHEATDAFFNTTKLFQSKDTILRRLMYIAIKELSKIAENVYVVTSSLTTDMNAKDELCRPQALRALCHITDQTTFQGIERYMKQAIVDKNPAVSSAALVSAIHLSKTIPDGVKRWINEAQEAIDSDNVMVQHHALGLLYHIRKSDRLAVSKLVTKCIRSGLKSPYAICMLIRIVCNLIEEEGSGPDSPYFEFIDSCLRHKSDMVVYEAANTIVHLSCTTQRELSLAISILQLILSSPKPTLRFAAVRTLNKVAMTHPASAASCNLELESLITDNNRSVATLAITTLLKIGREGSIDYLLKQVSSFMSEISDEFKIVVVHATRQLCSRFPHKCMVIMSSIAKLLRDEGGGEFKKAIVATIINIIEDNPSAKEAGLAHLCEFIEDCEHTELAVKILHLLGKEGPKTSQPGKYIRFIYNRLILEISPIQAAAVSSLAKFGAHCDELLPNILVLLQRSAMDMDDEVRDRATYYYNILKLKQKVLCNQCISSPLQVSLIGLEKALKEYVDNVDNNDIPFDIKSVPLEIVPVVSEKKVDAVEKVKEVVTRKGIYEKQLENIEQLNKIGLGPILKSSLPVELTESETEYVVTCVKHIFEKHIVLQFDVTNTLNDQILENVRIEFQAPEGFNLVCVVPIERLEYNNVGSSYVCIEKENDDLDTLTFTIEEVSLKYIVKDCDPNTGTLLDDEGYKDEYALEDVDLLLSDYMERKVLPFEWDREGLYEHEDTYVLSSFSSLEEAIANVLAFVGMAPIDRTDVVEKGVSHTLCMSGVLLGKWTVLGKARLVLGKEGVTMSLAIRCEDERVAIYIATVIV